MRKRLQEGRPVLRIGHSPDPDDAFMWWPLAEADAVPGRFRYEAVRRDIEDLNRASEQGELEITAISAAQYACVADRYALTSCGSSIGDGYGPRIVAGAPMRPADLGRAGVVLAVPGERTSAFAAATILLGRGSFRHEVVPFHQIIPRVAAGEFAAGLVIHEGQLAFDQAGLHLVADLGMWWSSRCGLPLPLGVNAIRRDLEDTWGPGTMAQVTADLLRSIRHALDHRSRSLEAAQRCARGASRALTERFVAMYVNRWTLKLGPVGRQAIQTFLDEAHRAGLTPAPPEVDVVRPAGGSPSCP